MSVYYFLLDMRQGNDNIIPDCLTMYPKPNSNREFFIRITVKFSHLDPPQDERPTSRHVLEILAPFQEEFGEDWLPWRKMRRFMSRVRTPIEAVSTMSGPLKIYAEKMAALEENAGRRVMPLEVNLNFTEVPLLVNEKVEADGVVCCIYLDEMKVDSMGSKLPCQHFYHEICIKRWLKGSGTFLPSMPIQVYLIGFGLVN